MKNQGRQQEPHEKGKLVSLGGPVPNELLELERCKREIQRELRHRNEREEWWSQQTDPLLRGLLALYRQWLGSEEDEERIGRYLEYCNASTKKQLLNIIHRGDDKNTESRVRSDDGDVLGRLVDHIRGVKYPDGLVAAAQAHHRAKTGNYDWVRHVDEDAHAVELGFEGEPVVVYRWVEDDSGYVIGEVQNEVGAA